MQCTLLYLPGSFVIFSNVLAVFSFMKMVAFLWVFTVSAYFYNIWFNFQKTLWSIIIFIILEMRILELRDKSLATQQETGGAWIGPKESWISKTIPFTWSYPEGRKLIFIIFAFPIPHAPFPNTEWVQTLIKYLTKVTKKIHNFKITLPYPGSFTCVSRGTFSSPTQHTEAEFIPPGFVPTCDPFWRA